MRWLLLFLLLGSLLPAAGQADLCVKKATHSTSYADGEVVWRRQGDSTETWIGEGRVASHEGNKTILLDLDRKWFCIINHLDRTFVETSLPLDVDAVLGENLITAYMDVRTAVEVERRDGRREMASLECREYDVSYWDETGDGRFNERHLTVWATEDVQFDKKAYSKMLDCMRMLHNRDKKARVELEKIKGLQTGFEASSNGSGLESKLVNEIVEIAEKDPPSGIYSVPSGYRKKERLNDRDF
jgi:hypothetical protein